MGHILHSSILVPYHGWYAPDKKFFYGLYTIQCVLAFNICFIAFVFFGNLHNSKFEVWSCWWPNALIFGLIFRRISHRTHHQNHGHVENDESWHPVCKFPLFMASLFVCFKQIWSIFKLKVNNFTCYSCSCLKEFTRVWTWLRRLCDSLCLFQCLHTPFTL